MRLFGNNIGKHEIRSSFGLTVNESKGVLLRYARSISKGLSTPVNVEFADLPSGKNGSCGCVFGADGRLQSYDIRLRKSVFDISNMTVGQLDVSFVDSMMFVSHEMIHAWQLEVKDPEMMLSYLASLGNPDNYDHNNKHNRRELEAECGGLEFLRSYFHDMFPYVDGDGMLCGYVNRCADGPGVGFDEPHRQYFISKPDSVGFSSMDDVFRAFHEADEAAKNHPNVYPDRINMGSEDAFSVLTGLGFGKTRKREWDFAADRLRDAKDAHESDMILASLALYQDPSLKMYALDMDVSDLDFHKVFGRYPPGEEPVRTPSAQKAICMAEDKLKARNGLSRDGPDKP